MVRRLKSGAALLSAVHPTTLQRGPQRYTAADSVEPEHDVFTPERRLPSGQGRQGPQRYIASDSIDPEHDVFTPERRLPSEQRHQGPQRYTAAGTAAPTSPDKGNAVPLHSSTGSASANRRGDTAGRIPVGSTHGVIPVGVIQSMIPRGSTNRRGETVRAPNTSLDRGQSSPVAGVNHGTIPRGSTNRRGETVRAPTTPLDTEQASPGAGAHPGTIPRGSANRRGETGRAPTTPLDTGMISPVSIIKNPHKATYGQGEADPSATSRVANPASRSDTGLGGFTSPVSEGASLLRKFRQRRLAERGRIPWGGPTAGADRSCKRERRVPAPAATPLDFGRVEPAQVLFRDPQVRVNPLYTYTCIYTCIYIYMYIYIYIHIHICTGMGIMG